MSKIYGIHDVSEEELILEFPKVKILVRKTRNGIFLYKRVFDGEFIEKTILSKTDFKLGVYPISPVSLRLNLSNHTYLKLKQPLIISSNTERTLFLKAPVNIGIYYEKEEGGQHISTLIDTFSVLREKYALYGMIENGYICRYFESELYDEEPQTNFGEAIVKLVVTNLGKNTVEISKVIIPVTNVYFYYGNNKAYYGIVNLAIHSKDKIVVKYTSQPVIDSLRKSPLIVGTCKPILLMEWGV